MEELEGKGLQPQTSDSSETEKRKAVRRKRPSNLPQAEPHVTVTASHPIQQTHSFYFPLPARFVKLEIEEEEQLLSRDPRFPE
jgi:hypothetical protein